MFDVIATLCTGRAALGKAASLACALVAMVLLVPAPAQAQSWGGLYNMDNFLRESHPFGGANRAVPQQPPLTGRPAPVPTRAPTAQPPNRRQPAETADAGSGWSYSDVFSEIRAGVLAHDAGPFSAQDEGGIDTNIELLFASPDIFDFMWSPRPHIGISYNSGGDTSQVYTGLSWEWSFWDGWFAGFSLGGMVHDGHLVGVDNESKSLGCRVLFRESINVGYRFMKRHAIMAHIDHSSNASLCEKNTSDGTATGRHDVVLNEGLESVGVRYGYLF